MGEKIGSVCIIDDEADIVESFSSCLSEDYHVRTFTSAKSALKEFDNGFRPEVIITDLRMPEMDGFSLLAELKKRKSSSHLLVISGHADKADVIQAANFGVAGFIEKPFTMRQLKEALLPAVSGNLATTATFEILCDIRNLVRDIETLRDSHFRSAVIAESCIVNINGSPDSSIEQKKAFLQIVHEERVLENKTSLIKKNIQNKLKLIGRGT